MIKRQRFTRVKLRQIIFRSKDRGITESWWSNSSWGSGSSGCGWKRVCPGLQRRYANRGAVRRPCQTSSSEASHAITTCSILSWFGNRQIWDVRIDWWEDYCFYITSIVSLSRLDFCGNQEQRIQALFVSQSDNKLQMEIFLRAGDDIYQNVADECPRWQSGNLYQKKLNPENYVPTPSDCFS